MVEHANNVPPPNPQNGNEVNNIPQSLMMEGLYWMIRQLQDQNRKLSAQMAAMNQENSKRENEANSRQNNDDSTRDKEENNTCNTRRREKTYQMTTTQGPLIYFERFSEFIMSMVLPENFNGTSDPQVYMTMFKSMMLVNGASDPCPLANFSTFLENTALLWFSSLLARTIHDFAKLS